MHIFSIDYAAAQMPYTLAESESIILREDNVYSYCIPVLHFMES